MMEVKE